MKNFKCIIFFMVILLFFLFVPKVSAMTDSDGGSGSGVTTNLGLGDLNSYGGGNQSDSAIFNTKVQKIVSILSSIGIILSVVGLIIIGLKYMLGSVEEKADYKKLLIPYIVGCFLVFTVSLIPQLIYLFMSNF